MTWARGCPPPAFPGSSRCSGGTRSSCSLQTLLAVAPFALRRPAGAGHLQARRLRRRPRHAAGQDRARDPPRRARHACTHPAHAVLRDPRGDDPVRAHRRRGWRWHGDRRSSTPCAPTSSGPSRGSTRYGDIDGDGLQEYETRSSRGLLQPGLEGLRRRHARRATASSPAADRPLRASGLVVSAKRAWADVLERRSTTSRAPPRLRAEADRLAELIEERSGGRRRAPTTSGSTATSSRSRRWPRIPAICCGPARSSPTGPSGSPRGCSADDMWSAAGASGLARRRPRRLQPVLLPARVGLAARQRHRRRRLSPLRPRRRGGAGGRGHLRRAQQFAGPGCRSCSRALPRDDGGFPVQYLGANVPQAWASGAVVHLVTILLGLEVDAARRAR